MRTRLNYIIFIAPLLVSVTALCVVYPFLAADTGKYLLFQIFCVFLPGHFFASLFIRKPNLSFLEKCLFGYPVSVIWIVGINFLGKVIHLPLTPYVLPLTLAAALIHLGRAFKKGRVSFELERDSAIAYAVIFSICMVIFFVMYILSVAPPTENTVGLYYHDQVWCLGNTWSYIRGWPMTDARLAGLTLRYHMVQGFYHAAVYELTGIDPFHIQFTIDPIFVMFYLVAILILGVRRILDFSRRRVVTYAVAVLFMAGITFELGGMQGHIFYNPISFFFGLPCFILYVITAIDFLRNETSYFPLYFLPLFLLLALSKAHLAVVLPAAFAAMTAVRFFQTRKLPWAMIAASTLLVAAGLILTFGYYGGMGNSRISSILDMRIAPGARSYIFVEYFGRAGEAAYFFMSRLFRNVCMEIFRQPYLLLTLFLFCISGGFRAVIRKERAVTIFMVIFAVCNFMPLILLEAQGGEVYFHWLFRVVLLLYGAILIDFLLQAQRYRCFAWTVVVLLAAFGLENFIYRTKFWIYPMGWWRCTVMRQKPWDERATISLGEWQALQWIKKNTRLSDVIISDRRGYRHSNLKNGRWLGRFFAYSGICGRQFWVEGDDFLYKKDHLKSKKRWDILNVFLQGQNRKNRLDALRQIDADYFLQSRRFNKSDFTGFKELRLVYQNPSALVYKIKREAPANGT